MCKPPWGIQTQQRTCWAMGRGAWRNEALLARSLLPLTCWDMLGAERRAGRATTAPGRTCRADGSWQESGCHGHAESPAGHSAVFVSVNPSSTHRGSPGRAVQLLRERFSAGLEGGRLAVPEGRWALPGPGPGPGRARTWGAGEKCVTSQGLDSSVQGFEVKVTQKCFSISKSLCEGNDVFSCHFGDGR